MAAGACCSILATTTKIGRSITRPTFRLIRAITVRSDRCTWRTDRCNKQLPPQFGESVHLRRAKQHGRWDRYGSQHQCNESRTRHRDDERCLQYYFKQRANQLCGAGCRRLQRRLLEHRFHTDPQFYACPMPVEQTASAILRSRG